MSVSSDRKRTRADWACPMGRQAGKPDAPLGSLPDPPRVIHAYQVKDARELIREYGEAVVREWFGEGC